MIDPQMLALLAAGQEPRLDEEFASQLKQIAMLSLIKTVRNDRSGFRTKRALWDAMSMIGTITQRAADPNKQLAETLVAMGNEG